MGCFAFKSGGKSSGGSKAKQHPRPGTQTPPDKSTPASSSSSSGGVHSKTKASAASTPTRTIQELSEERGAQRSWMFDLDELVKATNGFSCTLKVR